MGISFVVHLHYTILLWLFQYRISPCRNPERLQKTIGAILYSIFIDKK